MVYLIDDGRQFSDKQFIQEGEQFIEIPNFIEPREEDGFIVYVSGIENGKPKYTKEEIKVKKPQPTQLDSIEQTQLLIMEAMADQYEQRLETDLMMMDAQATTFEAVLSLSEGGVQL
jgi:hypothetical protein|nr:MAG TPA: hypothetical protein [Caudoviricetes sp.]